MVCRNCGKILEDGEIFCPACGTKAEPQLVNDRETGSVQSPAYSSITYTPDPVQDSESTVPPSYTSVTYTPEPQQTAAEAPKYTEPTAELPKEKEFFGKGAFLLCLIIIAMLAGTAGAFAYMYFSVIGIL